MIQEPTGVGVIGCGNISAAYLRIMQQFDNLRIICLADIVPERAEARAREFGIEETCTVEELLSDDRIRIVLNLTIPGVHASLAQAALDAGKHVYNEKPLALLKEDGMRLLDTSARTGLRVGCAPDTFLGAGLQTCRKLIDEGAIGTPISATAFMLGGGPEGWHPDPEFFYKRGAGPMFDMGPYYLTALVALLGPVRRLTGVNTRGFATRVIGSQPFSGQQIEVEVPTTVMGLLEFVRGPVATLVTSFDVVGHHSMPRIEIHGTEGSLAVPDPNTFGGPVRLARRGTRAWEEVPLAFGYAENSRGLGVADLAAAIESGRAHRAGGDLAYHVLELMHGFHESAERGRHIQPTRPCAQPAPLPEGLAPGTIDP